MAFQCGFFNSVNGDRRYTAEQMNNPYKGIVSNGVLAKTDDSTSFQVQEKSGLNIVVKEGYGIFADKWAILDVDLQLTIPTPHVSYARIDSVIVRIDLREEIRNGSIEYVQGTPQENPVAPELIRTSSIIEYRLANITVKANAMAITQANIEDTRPSADCGFVTNLLQNSDISATYAQWQSQFEEWLAKNDNWVESKKNEHEEFITTEQAEYNEWTDEKRTAYEKWFNNLTEDLTVGAFLQHFSNHYVTTAENETVIPIGIFQYSSTLDILKVYINGLMLIPNVDYTINDFSSITLTQAVDTNTTIAFDLLKLVTVTEDVENVATQLQKIHSVIPAECNEQNPLTDKQFVQNLVPVGTVLSGLYTTAPVGFLLCNGQEVAIADYPALYNVIGSLDICLSENEGMFKLPDMREVVMVGVGQNGNLSIENHDVYELGEFKDDQFQGHEHNTYENYENGATGGAGTNTSSGGETRTLDIVSKENCGTPRYGTTTHGKQLGVNYIIKY